ncbi:DUF6438 domain-containing protein [Alloalcanivorax mobilis]|uniref:DUF6438 domain-containing protein n=1 Tax=Alloalcanivorax mobilis TaxID=2019569 RepID=UPI0012FFF3F4|nr:DUF6438 domain-containing protein [Alloalcanivorax mobilis]
MIAFPSKPVRLMLILPLLLSACAIWPGNKAPAEPTAIRYQAGACFGTCPQFEYRIDADGNATFNGQRFTKITGEHPAPGDRATFKRLRGLLASARPADGDRVIGPNDCQRFATDHPGITVVWEEPAGERRLTYNTGCHDARYQALRDTLDEARQALPVEALTGRP